MAVTSTNRSIQYAAPGSQVDFNVNFRILRPQDILVARVEDAGDLTDLDYGVDYVVTTTVSGGMVHLTQTQEDAAGIFIFRRTPLTQETVYIENSRIPSKTVESDFDKATLQSQDIGSGSAQALKYPANESHVGDLPPILARRSRALGFDSNGAPVPMDLQFATELYLGVAASDPTETPDGDPLAEGMIYFNGNALAAKVYRDGAWAELVAPYASWFSDEFTGDGSETTFLFSSPASSVSPEAYRVSVDGLVFAPTSYSIVAGDIGTASITLDSAPDNGAEIVVVYSGTLRGQYKLGNQEVTTANLRDGSVTSAKLASESVTADKIPDNSIPLSKIIGTLDDDAPGTIPVGSGIDFWGETLPPNFEWANGQAISRAAYPIAFARLGTTYGAGDGTTTFNLPDKRERVSVARSDMGGGSPAGRMPNSGPGTSGIDTAALGSAGGVDRLALTAANNGPHGHVITGSSGSIFTLSGTLSSGASGHGSGDRQQLNVTSTQNAGSGEAHANVQPTIVCNYIIRIQ